MALRAQFVWVAFNGKQPSADFEIQFELAVFQTREDSFKSILTFFLSLFLSKVENLISTLTTIPNTFHYLSRLFAVEKLLYLRHAI